MPGYEFPIYEKLSTGSTDMGDLSCIMPVVHPYCGGSGGTSHGNDYYIVDVEAACVTNAKWQIMMLHLLLSNGAERAKRIIEEYKPQFASKEEFLAFQDSLNDVGDRIKYTDSGAEIRL
jgi:hypothetical protein